MPIPSRRCACVTTNGRKTNPQRRGNSKELQMKRVMSIVVYLVLLSMPALAQLTSDDWYRLNRVSDVQFAPDGKTIAYVVTRADRETQRNISHIWIIAA